MGIVFTIVLHVFPLRNSALKINGLSTNYRYHFIRWKWHHQEYDLLTWTCLIPSWVSTKHEIEIFWTKQIRFFVMHLLANQIKNLSIICWQISHSNYLFQSAHFAFVPVALQPAKGMKNCLVVLARPPASLHGEGLDPSTLAVGIAAVGVKTSIQVEGQSFQLY